MQLYEQKIDEALSYLCHPDRLHPTGDKPICYVTYDVEDAMIVYRMIATSLIPKAKFYGFKEPRIVSLGEEIQSFIKSHDYYDVFQSDEMSEQDLYESLRIEILNDGNTFLPNRILEIQREEMEQDGQRLIVFKDLELLHPYVKIGAVEQIIYNRIEVPMLFLYPGNTQGTARQFLNIYPLDGSYRSKNF